MNRIAGSSFPAWITNARASPRCSAMLSPAYRQFGHTAQRYTHQLKNLFVHNSPSRVGKAVEIILVSSATLMLFSHMVVVIRQLRG